MNRVNYLKIVSFIGVILIASQPAVCLSETIPAPAVKTVKNVENVSKSSHATLKGILKVHRVVTTPIGVVFRLPILNHIKKAVIPEKQEFAPVSKEAFAILREKMSQEITKVRDAVVDLGENMKSKNARQLMSARSSYIQGDLSFHDYFQFLLQNPKYASIKKDDFMLVSVFEESLKNGNDIASLDMKWEKLFEEVDKLHFLLLKKSAVGIEEKLLVNGFRDFDLLERIVYEEAIPNEMDSYFDGKEFRRLKMILGYLNRDFRKQGREGFSIPQFQELIYSAKHFYSKQTLLMNLQLRINQIV